MAQVPYAPASTTTPTHEGVRGISIEAPLSSFGGDIARAMGQFAAQLERSGDEVFARGFALKQMDEEAKATEADTLFMEKTAETRAAFHELRGRDAKEAYPQFQQDLQDIRRQVRDGLTSPHAQRAYDRMTLPTLGRTFHAGASHAASEQKKYVDGATQGNIDGAKEEAARNPGSPTAIAEGLMKIDEGIKTLQASRGMSDSEADMLRSKQYSDLIRGSIESTALNDPEKAQVMLEGPYGGMMRDDDRRHVTTYVQSRRHQVQGTVAASAINKGYGGHMSARDIEKVEVLDSALQQVIRRAQQSNPRLRFTIGDKGEANGRSTDLVYQDPDGKPNPDSATGRQSVEAAMQKAADELGIPLDAKLIGQGIFALPAGYDSSGAPKERKETPESRSKRAEKYAAGVPGSDPLFPELVGRLVQREAQQDRRDRQEQDFDDRQTINMAAFTVRKDTGKPPTNLQQLIDTPERKAAWQRLVESRPDQADHYLKQLDANARGDIPLDDAGRQRILQLDGMRTTDPVAYLEVNAAAENLPLSYKREILRRQEQLKRAPEVDPRVARVMTDLAPSLRAAGIASDQNKRQNEIFAGALMDRLLAEQSATGKRPTAERAHAIGLQLLQKQPRPGAPPEGFFDPAHFGWIFGRPSDPVWQSVPSQLQKEQIIREYQDKFEGVIPDDATIQRRHTGKAFEKFYGPAGRPSAPVSGAPKGPVKTQERVTPPISR